MKAAFNTLFSATARSTSRRLTGFAAACGLLMVDKSDADAWVMIAISYIAGQAAPAMAKAFRG